MSDSKKTYLTLVHGNPKEKERTITSYLAENKAFVVYSTSNTKEGRLSHTAYRVIGEIEGKSLLEVDLLTGRNIKFVYTLRRVDILLSATESMAIRNCFRNVWRFTLFQFHLSIREPVNRVTSKRIGRVSSNALKNKNRRFYIRSALSVSKHSSFWSSLPFVR